MAETTVIVATYGNRAVWDPLAVRAIASAETQNEPVAIVRVHGDTLHGARNEGLAQVKTELVVHLDADDELEPGYIQTMLGGSADVRAPSVRYVRGPNAYPPRMPNVAGHTHDCAAGCLADGNWLVVGAAARAELLRKVGGWRDWPMYEDWCLWLRCHLAGASFEAMPQAVYRAHVRTGSRNRASNKNKLEAHRMIARANGVPVP